MASSEVASLAVSREYEKVAVWGDVEVAEMVA
jgi:hypothetical protein